MAVGSDGAQDVIVGGTGTLVETQAEHEVFPPFDSTTYASQLLWLAVTFGVLYYLLARVALPRIAGILEDRRDRVASDLDMAERLRVESEEALADYEKALAQARSKAFGIAEAAREAAKSAADARRAEIEADLDRKLASADARIAEVKSTALSEVGSIAADAAEEIVKALIGVDVSRGEADKAVSESMTE